MKHTPGFFMNVINIHANPQSLVECHAFTEVTQMTDRSYLSLR